MYKLSDNEVAQLDIIHDLKSQIAELQEKLMTSEAILEIVRKDKEVLTDRIHRRNLQIAELKKRASSPDKGTEAIHIIQEVRDSIDFKYNNRSALGHKIDKFLSSFNQ